MESEFREWMDNHDAICPYCSSKYQVESEDYDEETRVEECENCGKKYWIYQSFSVTHHTRPDCELNGVAHHYQRITLRNGKEALFCNICDNLKKI